MFELKRITAHETWSLRRDVLGQGDQPIKPGDDAPDTGHFGAFLEGRLVGIASFYRERFSDTLDDAGWRLRGMATLTEVRGMGAGRALMNAGRDYLREQRGTLLWCNAREDAVGFYQRMGMGVVRQDFVPGHGERIVMVVRL